MAQFLPFNGLLPTVERVELVAAVPYDVVNSAEAAELAKGNPYSFLHVSRPEIDLAPGIDLHSEEVYNQARTAFQKLCKEAPLTLDAGKHLYIYQLQMNDHIQTGIIGEAVQSVVVVNEFCLLQSVAFQRIGGFGNISKAVDIVQTEDFKFIAYYSANF